jgi:hypothetical protein
MEENMKKLSSLSLLAGIAAFGFAAAAYGQASPNMAGTFRCQADVGSCQNSGNTFTVTQTGANLEVKNEKGELGSGTVTSNITISMGPPWNMMGVISNNNRQIEWSNGTKWMKQ